MTGERRRARSRRSVSAGRPRSYRDLYKREGGREAPQAAPVSALASVGGEEVHWGQEYAYVVADLRRLMVVSGVLLLLIVVAGFFF
jgi:hypothetical protein